MKAIEKSKIMPQIKVNKKREYNITSSTTKEMQNLEKYLKYIQETLQAMPNKEEANDQKNIKTLKKKTKFKETQGNKNRSEMTASNYKKKLLKKIKKDINGNREDQKKTR